MTAILEFDDVVKSYGSGVNEVRALRGISLSVEPGEFVAVMGPSGCGKSTMLHLAGALETPSAGSVRVAGRELASLDAAGRSQLRREDVRYPDDFSGGQQQRIAIARAVVGERKILLADEPTGSLDTANGDEVIELIATLPSQHGTAVVLVTHEPRFASWADRVVFLRDGRVVDETPAVLGAVQ
jgi:putative ABC transport system ATP-binding protein